LTGMAPKAAIWDMDGVIADTAHFHFEAWQQIARIRSVKFTGEDFRHSFGKRNQEIITEKFGNELSTREIESLSQRKEEIFRRIAGHSIQPFPGVLNLLRSAKKAGWKMAVASYTPRENIVHITRALDIEDIFDAIVADSDVKQGKPDPEVFLTAAGKLGIEPERCIVIEDAIAGVKAAKAANMRCIAVSTTHPSSRLAEADLTVERLEKVTVATLESLLQ